MILDDPDGSLPTQYILGVHNSRRICQLLLEPKR